MSSTDSSSRNPFVPASDDPPEPTNQLDNSINPESDQESGQACIVPGPELGSMQNHRRDLVEALELAASGRVRPWIERYPLEKANEVRDRLEAGKVRYRAVLEL